MKNLVIGLILIVALGLVLYFSPRITKAPTNNTPRITVADYASCVVAGYPIEQTSPMTCTTPDGRTFTDLSTAPNQDVYIDTPQLAQIVTSPMIIKGRARGNWFFEANLPIELQDENGNVLAKKGYMTSDNWMTTDYVTIDTSLSFKAPPTDYGKLIIRNDNPSGLPENDKSFEVPVRFK